MRVFLDTSVLVASVVQKHESHARAHAVLDRVQAGIDEGFVSAHSLAEVYAVLTKSPPPIRHSPEQALLSIEENVPEALQNHEPHGKRLRRPDSRSGAFRNSRRYHLRRSVAPTARPKQEPKGFTLNLRHFQTFAPESIRSQISAP